MSGRAYSNFVQMASTQEGSDESDVLSARAERCFGDQVSKTIARLGAGGGKEIRTPDPVLAKHVLYQLSYTPFSRSFFKPSCSAPCLPGDSAGGAFVVGAA